MRPARALRIAGAVALVVGGLVHLQLYFLGYRSYPDANLGRSFVLNVIISAAVAALLVVRNEWWLRVAGIAVAVGTLLAFTLTRSSDVLFGFTEKGLQPSPQAAVALIAEAAAVALLTLTFVPRLARSDEGSRNDLRSSARPLIAATAAAAVVVLALGALWARQYGKPADEVATADSTPAPVASAPPVAASASPTTAPSTTVVASPVTTDAATPTTAVGNDQSEATVATVPAPATTQDTSPVTVATTTAPVTTVAPAPATAGAVDIAEFAFVQSAVAVPVGSTVTWTNSDQFAHSVVADDGSFESESLDNGDTFAHAFAAAGEFSYICGIHPYMEATITVTE